MLSFFQFLGCVLIAIIAVPATVAVAIKLFYTILDSYQPKDNPFK